MAGVLALIVAVAALARLLRRPILETIGSVADGRPRVVFLLIVALWIVVIGAWADRVTVAGRRSRVLLVPLAGLTMVLLAITPGRRGGERLLSDAAAATGSTHLADAVAGAALAGIGAATIMLAVLALTMRRPRRARVVMFAALTVYWVAAVAVGVSVLPSTITGELRNGGFLAGPEVLGTMRRHLLAGDAGPLGEFDPGLRATGATKIGCDVAGTRLQRPVDGCVHALELRAVARVGRDARRHDAGTLRALVLQAPNELMANALGRGLDGAHYAGGRSAVVTALQSFVVISVEDSTGVPRTKTGATARPLHRALAYLVVGETTGVFVAPSSARNR